MGGEEIDAGSFWSDLREQRLGFFAPGRALWRLSVPQTAEPMASSHPQLIEWGGGVRWISADTDAASLRSAVARAGGHATLFRGGDKSTGVFHPLEPAVMKIHRRLKDAFDPAGILNPGRMYAF
jgi:glycolate oxidase FAD binding subunit